MELLLLCLIPIAMAILVFAVEPIKFAGRLVAGAAWVQLAVTLALVHPVLFGWKESLRPAPEFQIDRLAAAFLVLTAVVIACALSHAHVFFLRELNGPHPPGRRHVHVIYACSLLFLVSMSAVYICDSLGYLWIAVEATTLLSAPLVYYSRTKNALEATWKYLIICSVGIAFALLGTIFIFAASQHGAIVGGSLRISDLCAVAPDLEYSLLRLGFIFCFLGYGTKAGMFPLHSWLPDAHSEAPAPGSAMLSGALLNCALFCIWRISQIVVASRHPLLSFDLNVLAGTATVVAAGLFLIRQHGLKRLWAYSSIENVGLMLVAIGLGSGPLFFLQAVNHSLAKVALFLLSGNVIQASGTKALGELTGIMKVAPVWGVLFAMSALAVTGVPPFGAFISEWLILARSVDCRLWWTAILLIVGLSLGFVAVCMHLGRILLGSPKPGVEPFRPLATSVIPSLLVLACLILGLTTSPRFFHVHWASNGFGM